MDNQVKLAVLEQKIEDMHTIVLRLDTAIEKLSEVNTSVSRMLAVHEERITKQEKIDELLFAKIDKLRDKMDLDHNLVLSRISGLEKKVWIGMGIIFCLSFVFRTGNIFSNILTPAAQEVIVRDS